MFQEHVTAATLHHYTPYNFNNVLLTATYIVTTVCCVNVRIVDTLFILPAVGFESISDYFLIS